MINYCDDYWYDVDRVICNIPFVEKMYRKTILITGATGMIGSSIVDVLFELNSKYNAEISIILTGRNVEKIHKRFCEHTENVDYKFIYFDATENKTIDIKADYIIYGASNANPALYSREPVETMLANLIGLNCVLSSAVKHHTKRLLYISSSEVYGKKSDTRPYSEEDYGFLDILNPRASYPSAKRASETLCVTYSQEYNLDTVIVRPGHIYGPSIMDSDTRASAEFTRNGARKENIIMKSAGDQLRSYCYSLDCASAILSVLVQGESCSAYNISNVNSIVTIRDIAEEIAQNANTKVVFENPSDIERKSYNLMASSALDSAKLEGLGWKAEFSIKEGIAKTLEYYK